VGGSKGKKLIKDSKVMKGGKRGSPSGIVKKGEYARLGKKRMPQVQLDKKKGVSGKLKEPWGPLNGGSQKRRKRGAEKDNQKTMHSKKKGGSAGSAGAR